MSRHFDAIVVGAGPAGSTAAYTLAKKGFKVLLLERGRVVGSKNIFGGRVYSRPLEEIYPNLKEAPIQRWVVKERLSLIHVESNISLDYECRDGRSFICYLSELASWMAKQAEDAGSTVVTEITVDSLVQKNGFVKGVKVGDEVVEADAVIDCEGVNRLLLEKAGLAEELRTDQVALGVKETLKLGSAEIESRFGLGEKEGLSWIMLGDVTEGLPGGAFLYTNSAAISLGLVLMLNTAKALNEHVSRLLERLRLSPFLSRYLKDSSIVEYSAHLIPEASSVMLSRPYSDGLLVAGDAAGYLLNLGYTYRGVDFAAYSGYLAAQAFEKAHAQGDFSKKGLECYGKILKESFVLKQMLKFKGIHNLLNDRTLFSEYPRMLSNLARELFSFDYETPTLIEALKRSKKNISWLKLLLDGFKVIRSI
ncbi:MAG: FAD-dependent oxidoreductase [Nitrososphaerales archaeon]